MAVIATSIFEVKIEAVRPYCVALSFSIASFRVENLKTHKTGPKISSCATA